MEDWLQKIVDDDDLGLLDVKPKSVSITADERLVKSFEEINKFMEENKREPELSNDILENSLYYRLEGIREDNNKINQLKEFDTFGLLKETEDTPQPQSIDDILNDDDLGLLSTPKEDDIFNLGHGLKKVDRSVGAYDYVARAKKCEDFDKFEPLFKACQVDLKNGKRRLMKFTTETSIKEGAFLVYRGMLLYVDKVGNFSQRNQRKQARLRCIYENGTESDILRNSLAKPMYSDGKIVTENYEEALKEFSGVTEEDKPSGYIYVLRSLSKDPQVKAVKDLYKIGYSETTVEDRIRNSANETTYLMAKVKVVSSYKMYNVNTQKFEDLLHRFFDAARLSIDVMDNNGTRHTVREWFQVPLGVIEQAIYLFQTGDIVKYQYSREEREIVEIGK